MDIYSARETQKTLMKNALYGASGKLYLKEGSLYYAVVVRIIQEEREELFYTGKLSLNMSLQTMVGLLHDMNIGIHHSLICINRRLYDFVTIDVD